MYEVKSIVEVMTAFSFIYLFITASRKSRKEVHNIDSHYNLRLAYIMVRN